MPKTPQKLKTETSEKMDRAACTHASVLCHIQLFATPWAIAHQAPLSVGFPRQEHWNGLTFILPEDLPDPGMEPKSPVAAAWPVHFLPLSYLG